MGVMLKSLDLQSLVGLASGIQKQNVVRNAENKDCVLKVSGVQALHQKPG